MNNQSLLWILALTAAMACGCEAPELPEQTTPVASDPESPPAETKPAPPPEPKEFTADSPEKGRRSKAAGGYLGAVGHARFWAEHELIRLNIEKALQLYEATNGNRPQSHDEFMDKIVRANQIHLPELPEGEEYIYDPELGKLMVQERAE